MNTSMADGRRADGERRRQRVKSGVHRATQDGITISVSGIARQVGVDRTFLYRHRDLLALIHAAELQPSASDPAAGLPVSLASLQAGLANAQARITRLVTRTRRLERRLSELMGEQTWREPGLGAPPTKKSFRVVSPDWSRRTPNCRRAWKGGMRSWRLPAPPTANDPGPASQRSRGPNRQGCRGGARLPDGALRPLRTWPRPTPTTRTPKSDHTTGSLNRSRGGRPRLEGPVRPVRI
ncbi:hypothetical protein [Streptomyces sp. UG1]|uniref:hypothetical protein n=1 Tax=Streptomyces sp. UG1 TaxID=3417652 RepID=UPI003CEBD040